MERCLAAILAADVGGYSRLIREDETNTLVALKSHLDKPIEPKIAERNERIVKLTGDGLPAELPSAVAAAQGAVEIQHLVGAGTARFSRTSGPSTASASTSATSSSRETTSMATGSTPRHA